MKKKKGFTLVELLVVIAILAVLATVSVVGYMGFTKKAQESNDVGLTTQMNTILQAEEVTNKPTTPHEAIKQLANGGVDVEKLTPTTDGYNYVYDLDTNRMFLLDNQKTVVAPTNIEYTQDLNVFAFVGSENDIATWNGYSIYLKSGFTGTTLNVSTGLDVGDNDIETINYVNTTGNAKNVVIRTNSYNTTLNINAGTDEVSHYGDVKEVNILKVKLSSYHEFGIVSGNINLAYGNVELEDNSSVSNVVIKEINSVTPTSDTVKVTVSNNAEVNLIISEVNDVNVTVEGTGADNVTIIKPSNDKFAAIGETLYDSFDLALETSKDSDTIVLLKDCDTTASELKNITIDLNGYTLTKEEIQSIKVLDNYETKIKNGKFNYVGANSKYYNNGEDLSGASIVVNSNSGLTLDNVELISGSYGIYPRGNAAYVNILNSSITASGLALCTNNKYSNNIRITIDSSSINAASYIYGSVTCDDTMGMLINVPSNVEINNSYIEGGAQGVFIREGYATVTNSTIKARLNGAECFESKYNTGEWNTGTNVIQASLVVGDWNKANYNSNALCTLINTKIISDNESWGRSLIVLSQDGSSKTSLNFDSGCEILDYYIHDISTSGIKKGAIEVNGQIVRAAE